MENTLHGCLGIYEVSMLAMKCQGYIEYVPQLELDVHPIATPNKRIEEKFSFTIGLVGSLFIYCLAGHISNNLRTLSKGSLIEDIEEIIRFNNMSI